MVLKKRLSKVLACTFKTSTLMKKYVVETYKFV